MKLDEMSGGAGGLHLGLGAALRDERVRRGLSLRELARRAGVSASLVSQIETGKVQPSVRTLYAMVSELGLSLDSIFGQGDVLPDESDDDADSYPVVVALTSISKNVQRGSDRRVIDLEGGVRWDRLTTRDEPGIEFLYVTYPPGAESSRPDGLVRHAGREYGVVLTGQLSVTSGFNDCTLGPGDSIALDSSIPHRLYNGGTETVEAVWVVLGRQ